MVTEIICDTYQNVPLYNIGIDFQPAQLQATSTYLTTALPLLTGVMQVYFRPEFRKLLSWFFKRLACRGLSKKPWSSTSHPQRSHASHIQATKEQEAGTCSTSKVANGNKLAIVSGTHVSHSNSGSALADITKHNQNKMQQILNDREDNSCTEDHYNEVASDDPTPKRLIRFFSQVAQREDSGVTITDYDKPTSP